MIEVPKFEIHELSKKKNKYCICIPVINEGDKITKQLKKIDDLKINRLVDIIICDGNSSDGSLELKKLKELNVRTLLIKKDKGKLSAQLRMGYYYALENGYQGIITVDGNNKDSMDSIPLFLEKLEAGFDFVQGSRFIKGGKAINTPISRYLALKLIHAPIISLTAKKLFTDTTNGFRGYSKNYLEHKDVKPFRNIFDTYELLAYLSVRASQLKLKVIEVPVIREYPKKGKIPTKISPIKGNIKLIKILFNNFFGKYNPKKISKVKK
jgi:dolichol-phosphate mannosyltransferase